MTIGEVTSVAWNLPTASLLGASLDTPQLGQTFNTYRLDVSGWVLGRGIPVVAVEFYAHSLKLVRSAVSRARPDVEELYSDVPWAKQTGFSTAINLVGFPGSFEFRIVAVANDGQRTEFATIQGSRAALSVASSQASPQPLLVTTIGRSGSTWLLRLLGRHPDVVVHKPFQRETRVAAYWLEVLNALSSPASHLLPLAATGTSDSRWWLRDEEMSPLDFAHNDSISSWLSCQNVEALTRFCHQRVTSLYQELGSHERSGTRFVAEKIGPDIIPLLARDVFPASRELILVRDLRDVFCSILAYTVRRGGQHFLRDASQPTQDYVPVLHRQAMYLLEAFQTRHDRTLLVKYEDLVLDPFAAVRRVLQHCDLSDADDILVRMVRDSLTSSPEEELHRTVEDPTKSIGRWRVDLPPSMQRTVDEAFGDVLHGFGYA